MLSVSGVTPTPLLSFTVPCSGPSFVSSLQSNTRNASQNELLGCPEISISNSTPNSANESQAVLMAGSNSICHCTIHHVRGASWEALVSKEHQDGVPEWMPAGLPSTSTLPPSGLVPCALRGF